MPLPLYSHQQQYYQTGVEFAKRRDCARLSGAVVVGSIHPSCKAPASRTHSKRFARWPGFVLPTLTSACLLVQIAQAAGSGSPPLISPEPRRFWKPLADEMYLQEEGEKIATPAPVTSLAIHNAELD